MTDSHHGEDAPSTITCDKCKGRGVLDVDDPEAPCGVELVIGRETIHCFGNRKHPGQAHMAILCDPCIMCGQFDECDETCGVYDMEPSAKAGSSWWLWRDGDLTVTRATEGIGQMWRDEFQPDSPYAKGGKWYRAPVAA